MNYFFQVVKSSFSNVVTNQHGSAINCNTLTIQVFISQCAFSNCSTTFKGTSSQRTTINGVGGGAIFLDINELLMEKCIFKQCTAQALGSALYSCSSKDHNFTISCLSDFNCGSTISTTHSIYAFETVSTYINHVNSSYSNSRNFYCIAFVHQF